MNFLDLGFLSYYNIKSLKTKEIACEYKIQVLKTLTFSQLLKLEVCLGYSKVVVNFSKYLFDFYLFGYLGEEKNLIYSLKKSDYISSVSQGISRKKKTFFLRVLPINTFVSFRRLNGFANGFSYFMPYSGMKMFKTRVGGFLLGPALFVCNPLTLMKSVSVERTSNKQILVFLLVCRTFLIFLRVFKYLPRKHIPLVKKLVRYYFISCSLFLAENRWGLVAKSGPSHRGLTYGLSLTLKYLHFFHIKVPFAGIIIWFLLFLLTKELVFSCKVNFVKVRSAASLSIQKKNKYFLPVGVR